MLFPRLQLPPWLRLRNTDVNHFFGEQIQMHITSLHIPCISNSQPYFILLRIDVKTSSHVNPLLHNDAFPWSPATLRSCSLLYSCRNKSLNDNFSGNSSITGQCDWFLFGRTMSVMSKLCTQEHFLLRLLIMNFRQAGLLRRRTLVHPLTDKYKKPASEQTGESFVNRRAITVELECKIHTLLLESAREQRFPLRRLQYCPREQRRSAMWKCLRK